MRKIRSIALSIATVILLTIVIPIFAPGLSNKVNAAGDVIEVATLYSLMKEANDSSNKNKTIKLTSSIEATQTIYVTIPVTLDLNGKSINFGSQEYLGINTPNASDEVIITGNGYIGGEYQYGGGIVYLERGTLRFYSGTIENKKVTAGYPIDAVTGYKGEIYIYTGTFISKYEWISKVKYPDSIYVSSKDEKTGLTKTVFDYIFTVAGKQVTRDNCKDILGDGVFSYDYDNKTLQINGNCDYDTNNCIIDCHIPNLIIDIQGPSSLSGWLDVYYGTTITGNNKLIITVDNPYYKCIMSDSLLIKDVSIECRGKGGGIRSFSGELTIENAIFIDNSDGTSIIFDGKIFNLKDCKIVEPKNAVVGTDVIYTEDESDFATKIVIQPDNMWGPIEYTWSDDYSKCTAKRVCLVDQAMIETETVTTTSTVKTPATTSAKGTTTYSATFLNTTFAAQTKDVQDIPVLDPTFEDFVERLYVVALGRASEPDDKAHWCKVVGNGSYSGADCARFFLTSPEFNGRNLNDEEYLKVLYKTFFDRDAAEDPEGFNFWLGKINEWGRGRVLEGFIDSTEWCDICATYGVRSGAMTAKATKASKNATAFATRLYTECLGREPEEGGLNFWSLSLTNQERTGTQAAKEFFYSEEFISKGLNDNDYVVRLYKTFMGREPDDAGKAHWINQLSSGAMNRDQVFDFFSTCEEFTDICNSYAIAR